MTLRPDDIVPDDAAEVLRAGVSEEGVADALFVAFCFNHIDRVADALGFLIVSQEEFEKGADRTLQFGYLR